MNCADRIRIVLYTEQPFVAEGMATVCHTQEDLMLIAWPESLGAALECLGNVRPDVLLVHLTAGISVDDLKELRTAAAHSKIIFWGQAMQLGVRILPDDTPIGDFLQAIRTVHSGGWYFEAHARMALSARQGSIAAGAPVAH